MFKMAALPLALNGVGKLAPESMKLPLTVTPLIAAFT